MEQKLIYKKMSAVLADIGAIDKGKKNEQQGYKFRGIDDVVDALHPVLAKHEVFFIPEILETREEYGQTAKGTKTTTVFLKNKFTFYAADGSSVSGVARGEAVDTADKASNKAMSASLKYMLLQTFCIPLKDLEDSDLNHIETTSEPGHHIIRAKNSAMYGKSIAEIACNFLPWLQNCKTLPDFRNKLDAADIKAIDAFFTKYPNLLPQNQEAA